MTLAPCTSCARHVRRSERACPFCGVAPRLAPEPVPRVVSERLHRSVMAILGPAILVGAAAGLDGCSSAPTYGAFYDAYVANHDAAIDRPDAGPQQGDTGR